MWEGVSLKMWGVHDKSLSYAITGPFKQAEVVRSAKKMLNLEAKVDQALKRRRQ